MASFDGTLKFDTGIEPKGFQEGLKKLDQLSMAGLNALAQTGMDIITGAVRSASDAVLSLGKSAVSVGSSFDSSMAQVLATMGITKDTVEGGVNSFELLRQAAQDAGANTTFSASEAAGALNFLALAGYDAATAADALPAVLDLAAAGGLDLAYASDLATDAMAALGIEASKENLTAFGDQMAKTASKANTSVAQLGEAILTVGGTAKDLAGGTTELNAVLGVLANRGIKGSEGGTHLRNMILSLTAPTETAAAKLEELGISALDAEGQLRPLNEVFAELSAAGASTADLNTIFNKTDLAAVQAMIAGCGEEFGNLTAALSDCDGAMAQMAVTMNDTLEGDMKSLQSKAEALGIAVYDGLNDPLREVVQSGGNYLSILQKGFENNGLQGGIAALGIVARQAAEELADRAPEVIETGLSVIEGLVGGLTSNAPKILDAGARIFEMLLKSGAETVPELLAFGGQLLGMLAGALLENLPLLLDTGKQLILDFVTALADPENLAAMTEAGTGIISLLVSVLTDPEFLPVLFAAGLTILTALLTGLVGNLPVLVGAAVQIIGMLGEAIAGHSVELATLGLTLLTAIIDAIFENLPLLADSALAIIEAYVDAITEPENMEKWTKAGSELLSALLGAVCDLVEIGYNAGDFVRTLFEEIGTKLGETDWAALGKAILDGIFSGLLGTDFDFYDYLDNFGDNWVSGLKDIFGIHSPSKVMRDEVGKYLALGIGEGFTDEMPEVVRDVSGVETELVRQMQIQVEPEISGDADLLARQLRVQVEPGAVEALQAVLPTFHALPPVPADSVPQIIHNTTNYTTNHTQNTQNNAPLSGSDGTTVQVFIGGEQLEPIAVRAIQNANAASGGDTL